MSIPNGWLLARKAKSNAIDGLPAGPSLRLLINDRISLPSPVVVRRLPSSDPVNFCTRKQGQGAGLWSFPSFCRLNQNCGCDSCKALGPLGGMESAPVPQQVLIHTASQIPITSLFPSLHSFQRNRQLTRDQIYKLGRNTDSQTKQQAPSRLQSH